MRHAISRQAEEVTSTLQTTQYVLTCIPGTCSPKKTLLHLRIIEIQVRPAGVRGLLSVSFLLAELACHLRPSIVELSMGSSEAWSSFLQNLLITFWLCNLYIGWFSALAGHKYSHYLVMTSFRSSGTNTCMSYQSVGHLGLISWLVLSTGEYARIPNNPIASAKTHLHCRDFNQPMCKAPTMELWTQVVWVSSTYLIHFNQPLLPQWNPNSGSKILNCCGGFGVGFLWLWSILLWFRVKTSWFKGTGPPALLSLVVSSL